MVGSGEPHCCSWVWCACRHRWVVASLPLVHGGAGHSSPLVHGGGGFPSLFVGSGGGPLSSFMLLHCCVCQYWVHCPLSSLLHGVLPSGGCIVFALGCGHHIVVVEFIIWLPCHQER